MGKAKRFVKDVFIVLTTEGSSDLVEDHVQATEEKVDTFDYVEEDLIAINAEKDEHLLYNIQLVENEDENEEDIFSKSTVFCLLPSKHSSW